MSADVSVAELILQRDPELFEKYLLVALNNDADLWRDASRNLCVDFIGGKERSVNDFCNTAYYSLYKAMQFHQKRLTDAKEKFHPIPQMEMLSALAILAQDPINPVVAPERIAETYQLWSDIIQEVDAATAKATIKNSWKEWLAKKKIQRQMRNVVVMDGEGYKDALEAMRKISTDIESSDDDLFTFDEVLQQETEEIERMPLSEKPFKKLNEVLGGGFGRTEHTLFIAPSGAGKTVIACQLAVDLALQGRGVLLITTEQAPQELIPRMISCASKYPGVAREDAILFAKIKDHYSPKTLKDVLPANQYKFAKDFCNTIATNIVFAHWKTSRTVIDIQTDLVRANKKMEKSGRTIDVVILDWIGKALAEDTIDQGKLRLLYQNAATAMKDLAISHNIATISLAQATADSVGKMQIDNSCIAECHSLHNEATVAIGISAMKAKDSAEAEHSSETYAEHQCFYCFKSRKSTAQRFLMRRNFKFQRFDSA